MYIHIHIHIHIHMDRDIIYVYISIVVITSDLNFTYFYQFTKFATINILILRLLKKEMFLYIKKGINTAINEPHILNS